MKILKKTHYRNSCRQILIAFIFSMAIVGCSGPNELGVELLPSSDLIRVGSKVDSNISAYIFDDDSVKTDESDRSLLGSIIDPVFGKTTVDLACQFRLSYFAGFEDDAVIDSFNLYLYYKYIYGDTLTKQHLKVYELENPLDVDAKYYNDQDLSAYAKNKVLADFEFIPERDMVLDTIYKTYDTLYQLLKIPMDMSLAEKLLAADSATMRDNDLLVNYFKGLYIDVDDVASSGSILSLELVGNSEISGSALVMFYRQTNPDDGTPDTTNAAFMTSKFSARINSFDHDYSATSFANNINNEQQQPGKLYLQSTGGLQSKLYIPGLDSWKDSVNVAVNKAELVFTIDSLASDPTKNAPPKQLLLTLIDSTGKEYLPYDYSFNSTYYGGVLDTTDYTYRFNIAQHLQAVVDGKLKNNGFYLSVGNKSSEYSRVILEGGGESKGIKLNIAYSKIMQ